MGKAEFEQSLASGRHQALASMSGNWEGATRVWFEPDKPPAKEMQQSGTLRSVLGGRFLLHEYRYGEGEQAGEGIALYGLHLDENAYEAAWVDSFHNGSAIMFSTAPDDGGGFKALGSYGDGQGGPRWGWRTEIAQPSADELVITMFNIAPDGGESKALETRYGRVVAATG